VGKGGTALAFDPNPHVFKILKQNSELNKNITNILPFNLAITTADGFFFFNSSEATFNNGGVSSNQKNHNGKYALPEKVRGINLENYLETNFKDILPKLSLIKVDAEGYDFEILRSISSLVVKYHPHLIFECFRQLSKHQRDNLYHEIADKNYDLYYVEAFDENAEMKLLKEENMMDRKHFDVLAVPK
jgi:FkbM family methyltransferase